MAKQDINASLKLIDREISKRACERSLHEFVRQSWHIIEPSVPFVDGPHIQAICEHLEAVTRGQIKMLLINIPPRFAKSTIVSVLWPCWEWTTKPGEQYLCASYSSTLSIRDAVASRNLLFSNWYQERWGKVWSISSDQNTTKRYSNDKLGRRISTSVRTGTGEGGSRLILDDPHNATEAQSDKIREGDLEWLRSTWIMRRNDVQTSAMVTVMQRLHTNDASQWMLEQGAEHLCLPMEYDGVRRSTSLGVYDKRTTRGELLWPAKFPKAEVQQLKLALGEYGTSGQLQQTPSPAGGGILKSKFMRLWPHDEPLPILRYIVQSYDTAQGELDDNDPTGCNVWGVFDRPVVTASKKTVVTNIILLDNWAERLSYPKLLPRVMKDWRAKYGGIKGSIHNPAKRPDLMIVEKKGSGISLYQEVRKDGVNAYGADPGVLDKVARARLVSPLVEAGLVWVLESSIPESEDEAVTWAKPLLTEMDLFPRAPHDDQVDAMVQTLEYCHRVGWLEIPRRDYSDEDYTPKRHDADQKQVNHYLA